jgi:hypothetical protein
VVRVQVCRGGAALQRQVMQTAAWRRVARKVSDVLSFLSMVRASGTGAQRSLAARMTGPFHSQVLVVPMSSITCILQNLFPIKFGVAVATAQPQESVLPHARDLRTALCKISVY